MTADTDPIRVVARIDAASVRATTRSSAGTVVWRRWGAGPPLVLLHGASGSWLHWIRNLEPLARHRQLLVPDLPGFGDSDTPPAPHTAAALAAAVVAGIETMVPPGGGVDLAGFSFGGIVGGLVAARLGARLRTLVLLGAGGLGIPPAPMQPLRALPSGGGAEETRRVLRENLGVVMIADPGRIDDLAVFVQSENLRRARFKSGSIPASDVLLRALPAVRARLAGIWGRHDAFVGGDVEARRRLLATFQPDLDFRVVEAGHWVTYEAADAVNDALLDMLA